MPDRDGLVSFDEVITSLIVLERGSPEEKLECMYSPHMTQKSSNGGFSLFLVLVNFRLCCGFVTVIFKAYSPNGEPLEIQSQLGPVVAQIVATARALGQPERADLEQVCKRIVNLFSSYW